MRILGEAQAVSEAVRHGDRTIGTVGQRVCPTVGVGLLGQPSAGVELVLRVVRIDIAPARAVLRQRAQLIGIGRDGRSAARER
ncbi:hypothetical protein D9M72_382170 [compost metagenome]